MDARFQLIARGELRAVEVGERFWVDVDTPEDLAFAKRALVARLCKPNEDGFISRYVNRPVSLRVSERLVNVPITPNEISLLSFLLALGGAVFFGLSQYVWVLLGGFLIQLASVLDGCDGEVARLTHQHSRFGSWFDTLLDRYGDAAITMGITFGYWFSHPTPAVWLGEFVALSGFLLASYTKKEYALSYGTRLAPGIVNKLLKRDVRLFALFVGALFNRPFETLLLVGLLSHVGIAWMFLAEYRRERRVSAGAKGHAQEGPRKDA